MYGKALNWDYEIAAAKYIWFILGVFVGLLFPIIFGY